MTLTTVTALWVVGGLAAGAVAIEPETHLSVRKGSIGQLDGRAAVLDRRCTRALKRMRLEYRSLHGPYGGCRCIATALEQGLQRPQHQAALDTFLTAVLARKATDDQLSEVRSRFAKIRDFHSLTPASYRVVVKTTVSALQGCG